MLMENAGINNEAQLERTAENTGVGIRKEVGKAEIRNQ